jgi:hypothetical protein
MRSPLHGSCWDRVLWMFPHAGHKGLIHKNRELLTAACASISASLAFAACEVALASGQGGSPGDGDLRRAWGDSWQIQAAAAEGELVLGAAEGFDERAWSEPALGYRPSGCRRGLRAPRQTRDQGFRTSAGLVHLLRREDGEQPQLWPLRYCWHASFWLDPQAAALLQAQGSGSLSESESEWQSESQSESQSEQAQAQRGRASQRDPGPGAGLQGLVAAQVLAAGRELSDGAMCAAETLGSWRRPGDGRVSLCLELAYAHPTRALTERAARALHERAVALMHTRLPALVARTGLNAD